MVQHEAADEDAGPDGWPAQKLAGVFEGLEGDFEEEALLRVDSARFTGRQPEELRIEIFERLRDEARLPYVHLAWLTWIRIVKLVDVPTVGWHVTDGIHAATHVFPECLRGVRRRRQPAPNSDDGERFMAISIGCG